MQRDSERKRASRGLFHMLHESSTTAKPPLVSSPLESPDPGYTNHTTAESKLVPCRHTYHNTVGDRAYAIHSYIFRVKSLFIPSTASAIETIPTS